MVSAPYHLVRGVVWLNPDLEIRQRDGHIYGTFSGRAQLLRLHATGVGHRHRERYPWGCAFIVVSVGRTGDTG